MVNSKDPVIIIIIYRPPKPNSVFIHEFAELLAYFMSQYDKVLILGDFNIHVCCPSQTLVKDFMDTLESFNITQAIHQPTHSKGHILDLVLHNGLSPENCQIKDICVSDHKAILFSMVLSQLPINQSTPNRCRVFNSISASKFSEGFTAAFLPAFNQNKLDTEEQVSLFNDICQTILDSVAPYKIKKLNGTTQPWINEATKELKRDCRRKERKWKKTALHVFYQIWKDALNNYQKAVKEARSSFFSNLIQENHSNPRVLFKVIDTVMNPPSFHFIDASQEMCEKFLIYFNNKVKEIRHQITPPTRILHASRDIQNYFSHFQPVSMTFLSQLISQMKSATCSLDFIPTKFLKEVFNTIGPSILLIINSSLASGTFPSIFKHATAFKETEA